MTSQEPEDEAYRRPTTPIGPPVDPFGGDAPDRGAPGAHRAPDESGSAYARSRPADDSDQHGTDAAVVGEEFHPPPEPPRTEQERLNQYRAEQDAEATPKPPPGVTGHYEFDATPLKHPPDTVRQFSSLVPKPRRRRSDWPVLVFALVVAATVMTFCCLAGFALFASWSPFTAS
jgi:hypothetical protein